MPSEHGMSRAALARSRSLLEFPLPLEEYLITGKGSATDDRLLALVDMVRAVSVDPDPARATTTFVHTIHRFYGNVGMVVIGTRGAPPGHYRLTRLLHQPGVAGEDLEYAAAPNKQSPGPPHP